MHCDGNAVFLNLGSLSACFFLEAGNEIWKGFKRLNLVLEKKITEKKIIASNILLRNGLISFNIKYTKKS